jgi:hypothetical protein
MKSGCYVIHDASTLLDVASSTRCGNSRFLRERDQTAHALWFSKHSVHGLVAQKRRAGVLPRRAPALGLPVRRAGESGLQVCSCFSENVLCSAATRNSL